MQYTAFSVYVKCSPTTWRRGFVLIVMTSMPNCLFTDLFKVSVVLVGRKVRSTKRFQTKTATQKTTNRMKPSPANGTTTDGCHGDQRPVSVPPTSPAGAFCKTCVWDVYLRSTVVEKQKAITTTRRKSTFVCREKEDPHMRSD